MEFKVDKSENLFFGIKVACTVLVLILLFSILGSIGGSSIASAATISVIIVYVVIIALFVLFQKIYLVAYLKGNGVCLSERQFPEVYAAYKEMCDRLGMAKMPKIFVMQEGGLLNAFAVRFSGKNYIAVYSDIFSLLESDMEALKFVIGHELAHVKRCHMSKRFWTFPSSIVPFLTAAYSRHCELTCDNFGSAFVEAAPYSGMLLLAAGKELYKKVDMQDYLDTASENRSKAVRFIGLFLGHPYIPRRLENLKANFR
jgi:Zn-dependent protease with chaperone function